MVQSAYWFKAGPEWSRRSLSNCQIIGSICLSGPFFKYKTTEPLSGLDCTYLVMRARASIRVFPDSLKPANLLTLMTIVLSLKLKQTFSCIWVARRGNIDFSFDRIASRYSAFRSTQQNSPIRSRNCRQGNFGLRSKKRAVRKGNSL